MLKNTLFKQKRPAERIVLKKLFYSLIQQRIGEFVQVFQPAWIYSIVNKLPIPVRLYKSCFPEDSQVLEATDCSSLSFTYISVTVIFPCSSMSFKICCLSL